MSWIWTKTTSRVLTRSNSLPRRRMPTSLRLWMLITPSPLTISLSIHSRTDNSRLKTLSSSSSFTSSLMAMSFSRTVMKLVIRRNTGKTRKRAIRACLTRWMLPSRRSSEKIPVSTAQFILIFSGGQWQSPEEVLKESIQFPGESFSDIQFAAKRKRYQNWSSRSN